MTQDRQDGGARGAAGAPDEAAAAEPITVTDDRVVDPETGLPRTPDRADARSGEAPVADGDVEAEAERKADAVDERVAELTSDLQRLHAEYANYRKREQRERQVAIANAKASVIGELLDLLDDLDRARQHGDLESGPLKALGDKLVATLQGLGLEGFGEPGEEFDPDRHEAVQHAGDGGHPVLDTVLRRGYKVGDKILRTAMVIVGDGDGAGAQGAGCAADGGAGGAADGGASSAGAGENDDSGGE